MATLDRYGRKWNGESVGWVDIINNARQALYRKERTVDPDTGEKKVKLVYDPKRGMHDSKGRHIKELAYTTVPVLMKS